MPHTDSWNSLMPTHGPLQEPRSGRVVVQAVSGSWLADRGEIVHRDVFFATVRSDRDGQLRVWQLLRHQLVPERSGL